MIKKVRRVGARWRALCAALAVHTNDTGEYATTNWPFTSTRPTPDELRRFLWHIAVDRYRWSIWLAITVAATLVALAAHAVRA